jgi:hypothetical protein
MAELKASPQVAVFARCHPSTSRYFANFEQYFTSKTAITRYHGQ